MERILWEQITKAHHFVTQITSSLLDNGNVLLNVPENLPWRTTFYDTVEKVLLRENAMNTLKFIEAPEEEPGRYLLNHFCKKEKRSSYRYGISYAAFLAGSPDITLNSCYLWIRNLTGNKLDQWIRFIREYKRHLRSGEPHAVFILETADPAEPYRSLQEFRYFCFGSTIQEYDKFTFCALACSDVRIAPALRPYLVELTATLCSEDMELFPYCLERGSDFLQKPLETLCEITANRFRSDGSPFAPLPDTEDLRRRIWKSQLKLLFPVLEEYRSSFVSRYSDRIEECLPIENTFGEKITSPQDLQLGDLSLLIGRRVFDISLSPEEHQELMRFKKARDQLAHLKTVDYPTAERILSQKIG